MPSSLALLKALALTETPPAVNVRMLPADPLRALLPSKLNVIALPVDSTPMLVARLQSAGIEVPRDVAHEHDACLDLIMGTLVGPQLGLERLTFIYDYPASQAALARVHGHIASRFEAYMDGI